MSFILLLIRSQVSPVLTNHLPQPSASLGCSDGPKTDMAPARLAYFITWEKHI